MPSVTTFHLLRFPKGRRLSAVRRFVLMRQVLPKAPGAVFAKVMGCGQGPVFSLWPDWGRYAVLVEWESAEAAAAFFQSRAWSAFERSAGSSLHLRLQPLHSRGRWDGAGRFLPAPDAPMPPYAGRMAVLTRADVKAKKLRSFMRHAADTTMAVAGHPGLQFSLGMGEVPFLRQATFSIWDAHEAMQAFAYKNPVHIQAMRGKHKQGWYGQEMYVRFAVLAESADLAESLFA